MTGAAAPAQLTPATAAEAAVALRDAGAVRIRGGGTKLAWGRPVAADAELRTSRLDALVAHNVGDLTAVVQAGLPLARAQAELAAAGQMLALDPPDGGATIGGVVATGDSGPLRHRYGAPRDLVLGVQVALPDGTVARAGSQVIKNVAGYDLAKLMSGACGTLGLLTELTVRLHPRPQRWCTVVGRGDDPHAVARAASALAHLPLEAEALDLRWQDGSGAVLARFGGRAAPDAGAAAAGALNAAGLAAETVHDDDALWAAQRAGQRAAAVVRVSATQERLGALLATADAAGLPVVARAAQALAWLRLPDDAPDLLATTVSRLREALAPSPCVLLSGPQALRAAVDPWGPIAAPQLELMRRVKERFDPERQCNPGLFAEAL